MKCAHNLNNFKEYENRIDFLKRTGIPTIYSPQQFEQGAVGITNVILPSKPLVT